MSVNGVSLAVGQRWHTRAVGLAHVVEKLNNAGAFHVRTAERGWNVGPTGRYAGLEDHAYDLVKLAEVVFPPIHEDDSAPSAPATREYTGGSVSYYTVDVARPTTAGIAPYRAECNDIIEALGLDFAEGNAFKALWRRAAARNLAKAKAGYTDGLYDAEKVVFFGQRLVAKEKGLQP